MSHKPDTWRIPQEFEHLVPWMMRVAELWGPVESKAFIRTLSADDVQQLVEVGKWFRCMEHRRAAEAWCDRTPTSEQESSGARTMLRLANLLDRLGEAGVEPFASWSPIEFGQRTRIRPEETADWPAEFIYLKRLALRYGRVHSEQALIDQITHLSASERREMCAAKRRMFRDDHLTRWLNDPRHHGKKYHPILQSFAIMLDHMDC